MNTLSTKKIVFAAYVAMCVLVAQAESLADLSFDLTQTDTAKKLQVISNNGNIDYTSDGLKLSCLTKPWGSWTNLRLGQVFSPSKGNWLLECDMSLATTFFGQDAGIYISNGDQSFDLLVGRDMGPIGVRMKQYDGDKQVLNRGKASRENPPIDLDRPFKLRFVKVDSRLWGFYAQDDGIFKIAVVSELPANFTPNMFGVAFEDRNPYKREKRGILVGDGVMGIATFTGLKFSSKIPADALASIPELYVRLRWQKLIPNDQDVRVMFTFYKGITERIYRFAALHNGKTLSFKELNFHTGHPWDKLPASANFRSGEDTGFMNWSDFFSVPDKIQSIGIAFEHAGSPRPLKNDDGNMEQVQAIMDWATAPNESAIFHSTDLSENHYNNAIIIRDMVANPVKKWKIQSLREYVVERLQLANATWSKHHPNPLSKFIITTPENQEQLATLYSPEVAAMEKGLRTRLGQNTEFHYSAFNPVDMWGVSVEDMVKKLDKMQLQMRYRERFHLQLADEPFLSQLSNIKASPSGMTAWFNYLKSLKLAPADFGKKDWSEVQPLELSEVTDLSSAKAYYYTRWFIQYATSEFFRKATEASHKLFGDRVLTSSCSPFVGFNSRSDFFVEAQLKAHDLQCHHFTFFDGILTADLFRSASQLYGNWQHTGGLWGIDSSPLAELTGFVGLASGLKHFYIYSWPDYTRWANGFADVRTQNAKDYGDVERVTAVVERYEPFFIKGQSAPAKVALVLSRSSEIWNTDITGEVPAYLNIAGAAMQVSTHPEKLASGFAVERQMLHQALRFSGYTVDILPEEAVTSEHLKQYQSIYLYGPNLTIKAQDALVKFVEAGGTLFINAGAAEADEFNQNHSLARRFSPNGDERLVDAEAAGRFFNLGQFGEIWTAQSGYNFAHTSILRQLGTIKFNNSAVNALGREEHLNWPQAEKLATWASDNSGAIVRQKYGQGQVIKSGAALGSMLAASADPSYKAVRFARRNYSPMITQMIASAAQLANIKLSWISDRGQVLGNLIDLDNRALLLVANFSASSMENLTIRLPGRARYHVIDTFYSKITVKSSIDGDDLILHFSALPVTQYVELLKEKP